MITAMTIYYASDDLNPDLTYRNICHYRDFVRYVHFDVCAWHIEKNDPECRRLKCKFFLAGRKSYAKKVQKTMH